MKDYVLGFAFDRRGAVALICKARPDWQQGKWNGIGGHVERGEIPSSAMAREFMEETTMRIPATDWRLCGQLHKSGEYRCAVYTATVVDLRVQTNTDEAVKIFTRHEQELLLDTHEWPCLPNIHPMLALCNMAPDREGKIPFFTLDYTK